MIILASTMAVKTTHLGTVPVGQMITERNLGQHPGISKIMNPGRKARLCIQDNRKTIFHLRITGLTKIEVVINKQDLMKGSIGNTHLITTATSHLLLGSIPVQDLSATLIDLANIQSGSLEIMVANQRNQQEAFNELTRANKDKANNTMFASIKVYDGKDRKAFKEWINKINQACRASRCDFRTEIIKISKGAV